MMEWTQVVALMVAILLKEFATTVRNISSTRRTDKEDALTSRIMDKARSEIRSELQERKPPSGS